jgi:hypothetical protein
VEGRGQSKDLAAAIGLGALWVLASMLLMRALAERGVVARVAVGVMTLPLLWVAAQRFGRWRTRRA